MDLRQAMAQVEAEVQFDQEKPFVVEALICILMGIKLGVSKERIIEILKIFITQIENQL